jgi:hypothetical protein
MMLHANFGNRLFLDCEMFVGFPITHACKICLIFGHVSWKAFYSNMACLFS